MTMSFFRRHDRLLRQRVLLPPRLLGSYHVYIEQRSGGGSAQEAAALGNRIVLSARQISHRRKLRAVLRSHGRLHGEVSKPLHCLSFLELLTYI